MAQIKGQPSWCEYPQLQVQNEILSKQQTVMRHKNCLKLINFKGLCLSYNFSMRQIISTTRKLTLSRVQGFSQISKFKNNFLSTTNVAFIESQYALWKQDKDSVTPSFASYFELMEQGQDPETAFQSVPTKGQQLDLATGSPQVRRQLGVRMMIDRYRASAHQFADTDPLKLDWHEKMHGKLDKSIFNLEEFGFTKDNLKDEIVLKYLRDDDPNRINGPYTIEAMQKYLEKTYMNKVGYEYMYLGSKMERDFIKASIEKNIETLMVSEPSKEERLATFRRLCKDQSFIDFLIAKFANYKRFGIEGLNAVTSALGKLVETASESDCQHIVMGMAHRGRLNSLHCVFDKPAQQLFKQFLEKQSANDLQNDTEFMSGDVKYHLGVISKKQHKGKDIYLSMLPNPSHLEAVDPLVYGSTRAIQELFKDKDRSKSMGVVIHGDAALAGQGVVYESLQMQSLVDYTTGGIIHIVMNNQVGFTTNPWQGRSSYYCTQIAKAVGAPVLHINADEPDLLDACIKVAVEYRQKFKKDIFIDIIGYRRFGHNEQDQPFFTQPLMYEKIKNHPSVYDLYSKKLLDAKVLTQKEIDEIKGGFMKEYQQDYKKVMSDKDDKPKPTVDPYYEVVKVSDTKTGLKKEVLDKIFSKVSTWPQEFNLHPTIKKIFDERARTYNNNEKLDWATMQSLAFGTLLHEGYGVRLSGQDVQRGTFSHRHAYISDQKQDVQKYCFYKSISDKVTICNSHLSEYGVSGFEYGYSITNPNYLVMWEAQFGDFANGAAIMIDNFITSGESKWGIQSGLVFNLPHGMDGQGPQHSSGRLQRFLTLSNDPCDFYQEMDYEEQMNKCNVQLVTCSTTANFFHVLRRQLKRQYRKPLINFNSKKLLKFKGANRPIEEILEGTEFLPVIGDDEVDPKKVKKVLICNGQFYYELKTRREELKLEDVAIVRIEQIAPFPHQAIKKAVQKFGKDVTIDWVQEEHENYGAWTFINPRLRKTLGKSIKFHGRRPSAATAAGAMKMHKMQEAELLKGVFEQ